MNNIKKIIRIFLPLLTIAIFVLIFTVSPFGGHVAHAASSCTLNPFSDDSFSMQACIFQGVSWIAFYILTVCNWLVTIAGLLLDSAIRYGILYMQAEISQITTINTAWTIFRDLGNMVFIFIILYVAVATILDLGGIDTKRVIRNIIIVGLLVNFSLFFTKVLIDASNIVTINFYNLIVPPGSTIKSLSASFAGPLGVGGNQDITNFQNSVGTDGDSNTALLSLAEQGIGGSVFLIMVAVSFTFASILIIARFVILLVLMMLSPFAFFMFILPQTKDYAMKWWNQLRNQLIFAPLFMLLLYIVSQLNGNGSSGTLKLTDGSVAAASDTNPLKSLPTITNTLPGNPNPLDIMLHFLIMIFFLNLAIILALSAASGSGGIVAGAVDRVRNGMVSLGKKTVTTAGKVAATGASATAGAAGYVAGGTFRNTIGRAAYNFNRNNKDALQDTAAQGGLGGWAARTTLKASTALTKTGGKGGYQGVVDAQKDADKKRSKALGDKGELFRQTTKDAKGNDVHTYTSGGKLMKEARAQAVAKLGPNADILKVDEEAKKLYKANTDKLVKEQGHQKVSRQEVFAEEVLRKGNWLERTYSRAKQKVPILGSASNVATYQNTFSGHVEAAQEILKEASKKKNKDQLPRLKRERDQLKKEADAIKKEMDGLKQNADEQQKKIDELSRINPDDPEFPKIMAAHAQTMNTYNDKKAEYDKKIEEHDKKDNDVREAGEKEKKDDDKKGDDGKKSTT